MAHKLPRVGIFTTKVSDCLRYEIVIAHQKTPCKEIVHLMNTSKTSCILLLNDDDKLNGLITEQDIARRIAFKADPQSPASNFMTKNPVVAGDEDLLYQAISSMLLHKWQHMPVVDKSGAPKGIIRLSDALIKVNEQSIEEVSWLAQPATLVGMQKTKAAQINIANNLLNENIPVPTVQNVISRINNDVHRQALELSIKEMKNDGWKEPPIRFAMLMMGSGGRGESFLTPDQDNGFILEDYPDEAHNDIDLWFRECACRVNTTLAEIGFPLCDGYIMARNPMWRKSITQWKSQISSWIANQKGFALRYSEIFFDFDYICGERHLVQDLRDFVTANAGRSTRFLREMLLYDENKVALGLFNRLKIIRRGEHRGFINLKHSGSLPLVHYVRLLALKYKVPATSTSLRIKELHAKGIFDDDTADYLNFALRHITRMLLKQQLNNVKGGIPVNNHIDPTQFTKRERDMLIDAFVAIDILHNRLKQELTGQYFS